MVPRFCGVMVGCGIMLYHDVPYYSEYTTQQKLIRNLLPIFNVSREKCGLPVLVFTSEPASQPERQQASQGSRRSLQKTIEITFSVEVATEVKTV